MYPILLQMLQSDKKRHPASSHIVHEALQNLNLQLEYIFETTPTTYFLGTPPCWREHQPPVPFKKKKRPPSSWWVGPQVMAKHGGELSVKLNQPGKGSTFRALVVDICGIW